MGKKILTSKTLWVNLLAIICLVIQSRYGWVISVDYQAEILAMINLVLRAITKEPLKWEK